MHGRAEPDRREQPRVTVVGLGPAGPEYRSARAAETLSRAEVLLLRTAHHPGTAELTATGARALDAHYEHAESFEAAYEAIVEDVVLEAERHGSVTYAVPGSPHVLESTVAMLRGDPRVRVDLVSSLSFLDLAWERLGIDPVARSVRLVDGQSFSSVAGESAGPLLVAQVYQQSLLSQLKLALADDSGKAVVLHHLGLEDELVTELSIADLDRVITPDHLTSVYLETTAGAVGVETASLLEVVRELRERCPWDRVQTHQSLVRHFVEETYEAIEAIEALGDPPDLAGAALLEEELGDVLCQVLFHATIAAEEGLFSFTDVARTLREKLVFRHPHVYGSEESERTPEEVLASWETSKRAEKGRKSAMDGIPDALPALLYAQKVARRSAEIFDGDDSRDSPATLRSFFERVVTGDESALGKLLFAIAAGARLDVEEALRKEVRAVREEVRAAEARARQSEGKSGATSF